MNKELIEKILTHFGINTLISFEKIQKGFSSDNYKIETEEGTYFLKKHQESGGQRLASIEQAEQFFSTNNIPIIVPIKNKDGASHTIIGDKYYVLYPFVSGVQYESGNISPAVAATLGEMLAAAHLLTKNGISGEYDECAKLFKLQSKEETLLKINKLLSSIVVKSSLDQKMVEGLALKKNLVENCAVTFESFDLHDRHLCFGDYYPDNIFFDQDGTILHIFDLDMAGPTPRMFEVVRSCMLSCFWHADFEKKIESAKAFIAAYYKKYPFALNQLRDAIELDYVKSFYSTWREETHFYKGDFRTDPLYESHINSIQYLTEHRDKLFEMIKP